MAYLSAHHASGAVFLLPYSFEIEKFVPARA
jgi:hypothetical protein